VHLAGSAAELARNLLGDQPERWRHTVGVARRAADLADRLRLAQRDRQLLVAVAWLHDIGYSPAVRDRGFHPLDAARYLDRGRWPGEVGTLVAHHSGARFVAEVLGLDAGLACYPFSQSPVTDLLTYADQTIGPDGVPCTVEDRMSGMLRRHGPGSPNALAHPERGPYLRAVAARVRIRLAHPRPLDPLPA